MMLEGSQEEGFADPKGRPTRDIIFISKAPFVSVAPSFIQAYITTPLPSEFLCCPLTFLLHPFDRALQRFPSKDEQDDDSLTEDLVQDDEPVFSFCKDVHTMHVFLTSMVLVLPTCTAATCVYSHLIAVLRWIKERVVGSC